MKTSTTSFFTRAMMLAALSGVVSAEQASYQAFCKDPNPPAQPHICFHSNDGNLGPFYINGEADIKFDGKGFVGT